MTVYVDIRLRTEVHFVDFPPFVLKAFHCVETGCIRDRERISMEIENREFVCLANSRKNCGKCVAGLEWIDKKVSNSWIRPVLDREGNAISDAEMICTDNKLPRLLDIVKVPFTEYRPYLYQNENWLFDRGSRWEKVGSIDWSDLDSLADSDGDLWINQGRKNDRIHDDATRNLDHSLRLIVVQGLQISVGPEKYDRPVRAKFTFNHQMYDLKVTDPVVEKWARDTGRPSREVPDKRYLTISLAGPFRKTNLHHKLVAAIIPRPA